MNKPSTSKFSSLSVLVLFAESKKEMIFYREREREGGRVVGRDRDNGRERKGGRERGRWKERGRDRGGVVGRRIGREGGEREEGEIERGSQGCRERG